MQSKRNTQSLDERCAWMRARQERKRNGPVEQKPKPHRGGRPFGRGRRCKVLTPMNAAYIAGFFDGEGCACIYQQHEYPGSGVDSQGDRRRIIVPVCEAITKPESL